MAGQNNNSTRNRKIGIPDSPDQKKVAITEPSPMVQQMAAKNFALRNGGQMPIQQPVVAPPVPQQNFFGGGNQAIGKFDAIQTGAAPVTDFTNMPKQQEFIPQGDGFANPTLGSVQAPYMKDAADTTPQPQSNFEDMPQQPTGWNADGSANYDSLSNALSGYQYPADNMAGKEFEKNDSDSDGGFASWVKKILPKKRPGRREGETDEEYDRRRTRNMEMVATLFDAIRHMGNIINTSKGAPLQHFNDPTAMLEQGYQNRKAERAKREALAADQAYKDANLSLKERAAKAEEAYKQMNLGFKKRAEERAAANDEFNRNFKTAGLQRQLDNDKFNHELSTKKFNETARHNKVSESQGAARIALSQEKNIIARARLSHNITSGSGGGKSFSGTNLSSPTGHLNRKKELNAIEKKQITQYMIKNGYINKVNLDAWKNYVSLGDSKNANDLQNYWIAYAANMPGKKGDAFRSHLKNHYMYVETNTVNPSTSKGKSVVTVTQKGNKGKTTSKGNSTKNKFHVD